jgi:hypothetical protein
MEMSWVQILVIAFANLAWMLPVFFWVRAEARTDARHFDNETKQLRREMIDIMRSIQEDGRNFREQWACESKDFHGRLCAIDERRK